MLFRSIVQNLTRGSADSFLTKITEIFKSDKVKYANLGLLAWAPKLANDLMAKDRVKEASAHYESTSAHIGRIGEKVTVDFTLIEKRYFKNIFCWAVYGHDAAGNLITYWANKEEKIVQSGKISGKVKKHNKDEHRGNARITQLNFVRIV